MPMDSAIPPTAQDDHLVYRDGDGRQQIVSLSSGPPKLTIGRSANSDIVLGWDQEASRLHAQLEKVAADWVLIDDGISRNGTFVNGERLSGWRRLNDGDVVLIGSTSLTYRCGRVTASTPTRIAEAMGAPPALS